MNNWISVKDQLPKHKADLIVWYTDEYGEQYATGGYKDLDTMNWEVYDVGSVDRDKIEFYFYIQPPEDK